MLIKQYIKSFLLFLVLFFIEDLLFSQNFTKTDSLLLLLSGADEKDKAVLLNKISWSLRNSKPEEAIKYSKQAIELASKYGNHKELVNGYGYTGIAYKKIGNYADAFDYYFKGLEFAQKYNLKEQEGYARINIGNLYIYQEYYDEAIVNLKEGLKIASVLENEKMKAYCHLYLGRCFLNKGNYKSAYENLTESLSIRTKEKDVAGTAECSKDIGNLFLEQKNYILALENYLKCYQIIDKKSDIDLYSEILNNLAITHFKLCHCEESLVYVRQSLEAAQYGKTKLRIRNAYKTLSEIENSLGNFQKAYQYLSYVSLYNDSLFSEQLSEKVSNLKQIAAQQRNRAEIDMLRKDNQIQDYKLERGHIYNSILGISSVVFLIFIILGIRINKIRRKQNRFLKEQKNEIELKNIELFDKQELILIQKRDLETALETQENLNQKLFAQNLSLDQARIELEEYSKELHKKNEKLVIVDAELRQNNEELMTLNENIEAQKQTIIKVHKNITDSINYAKGIQETILPSKSLLSSILGEYFLFFKPRDKVSGDFYYANKIGNKISFAVADCTGHGVPGAFLTMLGITYLHEIVTNSGTNQPAKTLEILRQRFKSNFQSFGSENANGMDIALCSVDTQTNILQYAGAYNPLFIFRNKQILEFPATRNPIGFYPAEKEFQNTEIQLQDNDILYIFSDGFQDQLGGKLGRKYTKNKMTELFLSIHTQPLVQQEEIIAKEFEIWKQGQQQLDDIAILGVKWKSEKTLNMK